MYNQTIGDCLTARARLTPDRPAAAFEEQSCTWRQMDRISDYLAVQFLHRGMRRGSHVGIWGVNSVNWLAYFYGLVKIGAVPVLLNICYQTRELQNTLSYADVELLCRGIRCKGIDYTEVVAGLDPSALPRLRGVIEMEAPSQCPWLADPGVLDLCEADADELRRARALVDPQDTACIMFTSGTTARPKGVMLSHYSLLNNALAHSEGMHWTQDDILCMCVPLFHCFGITAAALATLHCGARLQLVEYYSSVKVMRVIQTYRCTVLSGVPSMFLALVRNAEFPDFDLSSLHTGVVAGSALSAADYLMLCDKLPQLKLQPAYGQTESSPCITMAGWDDPPARKAISAGRPVPGVEICIWDNTHDRPVRAAGETGEIRARGYNVMKGYYNMPDASAAAVTPEGWLRTGDLGHLDEEGYLYVTDRLKDIIIRGGENISPAEVERCIAALDGVQEVHVIGLPAPVIQEQVVACVTCEPGMWVAPETIRQQVADHLAAYKVPGQVVYLDEFPTTTNGKVDRRALKALAAEKLSAGD